MKKFVFSLLGLLWLFSFSCSTFRGSQVNEKGPTVSGTETPTEDNQNSKGVSNTGKTQSSKNDGQKEPAPGCENSQK
jgi:hypothetical protein